MMITMLGLICRATESIKTLSKQLGAIVWQAVALKPIWVFLAVAVISLPCSAEAPVVNGAKVAPEFMSSGKVLGKDLDQGTVKRMTAKLSENGRIDGGAEGSSSGSQTGPALTPESKSVAKPLSDPVATPSDYSKEQKAINPALGLAQRISDSEQWFWLLCFAIVALAPIFTVIKTPNVNVTGAARLHRAASVLTAGLGPKRYAGHGPPMQPKPNRAKQHWTMKPPAKGGHDEAARNVPTLWH